MPKNEIDLTNNQFLKISRNLEKHNEIFYRLWEMGTPIFSEETPTAEVRFDKEGRNISFLFNPKFWEGLDEYARSFIICHEALHVIFNHGFRGINAENEPANQAMDVVINHTLVNRFGFDRKKINESEEYCWVETLELDEGTPTDKTFEFYYSKIKNNHPLNKKLVDNHNGLSGFGDILKDLNEVLSPETLDGLKDILEKHCNGQEDKSKGKLAGTESGFGWEYPDVVEVKQKKKWETVIKKWTIKYLKEDFKNQEQWARLNRRFSLVSSDMFIPSEIEIEDKGDPDKIEVFFFLDTSGSCHGFKNRFFKACLSLPKNRFNVRVFCFDTQAKEVDISDPKKARLGGWGGTSFSCIEDKIQGVIRKEAINYPSGVFVLTDGYGDNVKPEDPTKWYWFLTENAKYCIPKTSTIHMLKDFE